MANTFKSGSNPSGITDSIFRGEFTIGINAQGPTVSDTGYYNGITPPVGGYTVYQTKSTQGPSIRVASDDNGLITIATQYGGTNISTVTDALNYLNSLSNTIVFNFDYPTFTTDGLVYTVDSGFTTSYPKTGSTWYDLGGTNKDATLFNTPSYITDTSGSLRFSDTSAEYATSSNLGNLSNFTVEAWFRIQKSLSGKVTAIVCNEFDLVNKLNFSIGTNNAPTSYNLAVGFFNGAWRNTTGFTPSLNTWYQVVGTYDGTTVRQYVNGVASGGTLTYTGTPQSGGEVRLMRRWDTDTSASNLVDGDLSIVRIYNRALSATEILTNYNSTKGRFGL